MNELTQEELDYIHKYSLSPEEFYDGRDESRSLQYKHAKENGCDFVIGTTCGRGHRLRTRHGHCIVCSPAAIIFQKRHSGSGALYIAESGQYKKIGVVDRADETVIRNREGSLNAEGGYGGITGWKIIAWKEVGKDLGAIEGFAHNALQKYAEKKEYLHNGKISHAQEVFRCTFEEMQEAISLAVKQSKETSSNSRY